MQTDNKHLLNVVKEKNTVVMQLMGELAHKNEKIKSLEERLLYIPVLDKKIKKLHIIHTIETIKMLD